MKSGKKKSLGDFLTAGISGQSVLELTSDRDVIIHGCKKILEYENACVRLRLCDITVQINGEELTMKSYYDSSVRVCGRITGIGIENKRS